MKTKRNKEPLINLILFSCMMLIPIHVQAKLMNSRWENYQRAAQLFRKSGATEEIIALCQKVLHKNENPVLIGRASFLLAKTFATQGEYKNAHKVLRRVYQEKKQMPIPLTREARLRDAILYMKEQKLDLAFDLFQKIANDDSATIVQNEARLALAMMAANKNEWEKSDSLITLATHSNPILENDERIIILQARRAIAQNEIEKAISLLKNSQSQAGLRYLAQAYEMIGKPIMAVSIYKKIHDLYPHSPEAEISLFNAAEVFMRAGDWLAAKSEFKRLLKAYPESKRVPAIHFRLGWINLQLDQLTKALQEFKTSTMVSNQEYFQYMQAEVLRRMGKNDPQKLKESIHIYNNIASLHLNSPIAPLAKVKAALTEIELGDSTGAAISLKQFLSLYPKDPLVPTVNFLVAINQSQLSKCKYLKQIINSGANSDVFQAALFALQYKDYKNGNYQDVINRNILGMKNDSSLCRNHWHQINHLLLAESAYYLGHYELAHKEYDWVIENGNKNLEQKAQLGKTWCLVQTSELDSAEKQFQHYSRRLYGTNRIRAAFGLATTLFRQKRYEDALQYYPVDAGSVEDSSLKALLSKSLYRSGECYYRLQYFAQAIEEWQKLVKQFPESDLAADATFQIADTYFRANHFKEAEDNFQLILDQYPDSQFAPQSALRLAQCAYNDGDYNTAIEKYEAFINNYPHLKQSKDALEGLQLCYYQIGKTDQASEALKKVIEQFPKSDLAVDARYRMAMDYSEAGDHQAAVEAFKEILTLFPNSSYAMDAQYALAKSLIAQEKYIAASQELKRFIEYFPQSNQIAEATYLMGVCYFSQKSYLTAVDYFNKIINQYSDTEYFGFSLQNLGWCYKQLDEKEKAIHYFSEYLNAQPNKEDYASILLQKGKLLRETDESEQAVDIFQELKNNGDQGIASEAAYHLGLVQLNNDEEESAVRSFKLAAQKGDRENYYRLSALAQLGAIYENNGNRQAAIRTYELLANSTSEDHWISAANERIAALSPKVTSQDE